MKSIERPSSRCSSRTRLSTAPWIETSSAEVISSAMTHLGPAGEGAGQRDALPLAAGELAGQLPGPRRGRGGPARAAARPRRGRRASGVPTRADSASAMLSPIVIRGSSEEYGSWKTIWSGPVPAAQAAPARPSSRIRPPCDGREADGGPRQRGLARAGLADQADDLAVGHGQAHAVDATVRRRRSGPSRRRTRARSCAPPRRRPRRVGPDSGCRHGSSACQHATRRPAGVGRQRRVLARGSGRSASGQRAAYAHPAGTCAGSTGRPGMVASGASRSVSMSGTAATQRAGVGVPCAGRAARRPAGPRRSGRRTSRAPGRRPRRRPRRRG